MDYAVLETDLVSVLNAHFAAQTLSEVYEARPMPENQVELMQPYTKGQCNVAYMDSTYGAPASTSTIEQMETVTVGIFMRCNTVKDDAGSYKLLAEVKQALLGYKPAHARTRMWISEYAGWEIEGGQIGNMLAFRFDTVNVQSIVEPVADEVISATGNIKESAPLLEVESDLYDASQNPAVKMGEETVVLAEEAQTEEP